LIFFIFANIPTIALLFLPKGQSLEKPVFAGWLAVTIALGILYFARAKLLPSSVIVVTEEEGFVKRNAAELSLVVAIVSAVLSVISWFFGKMSGITRRSTSLPSVAGRCALKPRSAG